MGAANWELILGTHWGSGDADACALLATFCSTVLVEIENEYAILCFSMTVFSVVELVVVCIMRLINDFTVPNMNWMTH